MKKILKLTLIILISVFILFKIGKYTGILESYRIESATNEPNLKNGAFVFGTNLISPRKFEYVVYNQVNKDFETGVWIHRLCGEENDTIEIINGTLFVNNKNIDENLNLKRFYKISEQEFRTLKTKTNIENDNYRQINNDSVFIMLSENMAEKTYNFKRIINKDPDKMIDKIYEKPWNDYNFGPLIIPNNYIFVLGDNRNNSLDSRFIGLIEKKNIKGTLIFK